MVGKRNVWSIVLGVIATFSLIIPATINSAQADISSANLQAIEQEIRDFSNQWNQMSATKNLEGMVALYASDTLWLPPNAAQSTGTDEVRNTYAQLFQAPNMQLVHTTTKISVARSGELATEIGKYDIQLDTPQGEFRDEGKYTFLLSKVNGEWKIAADMFNSSVLLRGTT
jgi:uncharacterized protein (TIGR02246 family)